jgi:lipopolysaccharide transport system permease protein
MTAAEHGFELHGEITPVRRLLIELWRARALVRALARRDFFVRYRRPTFGALWSVIVPLLQAVVLAVIFTRVVRIQTLADFDIPFLVFVLSGVVPWTFFSLTLNTAVRSITTGSSIASKVYFPRAVLPLASVGTAVYGYVPAVAVLLVTALVAGVDLTASWLFLVPATILMIALTAAFSLVLAALQVYFRDVAFVLAAVLQAWFYGSAVFFPVTLAPTGWLRTIVIANPVTGMVDLFRTAFIGSRGYTAPAIAWSIGWTSMLLIVAVLLYRRYDRVFVDLL